MAWVSPAAHLAGDGVGGKGDFLLGLIGQSEDGFGVAAQDDALLGELDTLAVALVQKVSQLVFQSGQLARERRLGDMQRLGRRRDGSLADDGDEIAERSQFHGSPFDSPVRATLFSAWSVSFDRQGRVARTCLSSIYKITI